MIDNLPGSSAFGEALANDEDAARQYLELYGDDARPVPPRISEFGVPEQMLAAIVDRLAELIQAVVTGNGGKPQQVKPWPRPVGAMNRIRTERDRDEANNIIELFAPHEKRRV